MDNTQLTAMTVKDLRECAKRLGIKRISTLKQKDLIEAIEATGKAANAVIADVLAEKESAKAGDKATKTDKAAKAGDKSAKTDNSTKTDKAAKASDKSAKTDNSTKTDKAAKSDDSAEDDDKSAKKSAKSSTAKPKAKRAGSKAGKGSNIDDKSAKDLEDNAKIDEDLEDDAEIDEVDDEKAAKEELREPDSIFIDRGAILPEYIPGTCLYALIRDPGTLFVYWNTTFESPNGWILTAYDASGNVLQSFTSPMRRSGRGYFRDPTARVSRVTLSLIDESGHSEVRLESRIRIAQQLGIAQLAIDHGERWVDFNHHQVVYEAPAQGRAPGYDAVVAQAQAQALGVVWTGGGYNRALDEQNMPKDATSSRFGRLSDTPSSDSHIGGFASSDKLVRR